MNEYKEELDQIFDVYVRELDVTDDREHDDIEMAFLLFKEALFNDRRGKKRKRPADEFFPCEDIDQGLVEDLMRIEVSVKDRMCKLKELKSQIHKDECINGIKSKLSSHAFDALNKLTQLEESLKKDEIIPPSEFKDEKKLIQILHSTAENMEKIQSKLETVHQESAESINRAQRLYRVGDMLHKMSNNEAVEKEEKPKKQLPSFPYSM